jgi:hypothetical protein
MSQENAEIVRRAAALFMAGQEGRDGRVIDILDPEIELSDFPGIPGAEVHRGHKGAINFAVKLWTGVSDFRYVPSEFTEAPDGALVCRAEVEWTGKLSGLKVGRTIYSAWRFRDGKVLSAMNYNTKAEALEAVGLSE